MHEEESLQAHQMMQVANLPQALNPKQRLKRELRSGFRRKKWKHSPVRKL